MTGGGRREGAGRPKKEDRKISYTLKLRPDQVSWLKGKYKAAALIERLIDKEKNKMEQRTLEIEGYTFKSDDTGVLCYFEEGWPKGNFVYAHSEISEEGEEEFSFEALNETAEQLGDYYYAEHAVDAVNDYLKG